MSRSSEPAAASSSSYPLTPPRRLRMSLVSRRRRHRCVHRSQRRGDDPLLVHRDTTEERDATFDKVRLGAPKRPTRRRRSASHSGSPRQRLRACISRHPIANRLDAADSQVAPSAAFTAQREPLNGSHFSWISDSCLRRRRADGVCARASREAAPRIPSSRGAAADRAPAEATGRGSRSHHARPRRIRDIRAANTKATVSVGRLVDAFAVTQPDACRTKAARSSPPASPSRYGIQRRRCGERES